MDKKIKIEINVSSSDCEIFINEINRPENKNTINIPPEDDWTNLYVARREKRLKQKDLAEILNIHSVTYSRKERGELEFTLNEAFILADYFKVSIEELFWYLRK